jgi:hypothetical protein
VNLSERDRRALMVLGAGVALLLIYWLASGPSGSVKVVQPVESADRAEKRLAILRRTAATVPGKEEIFKQVSVELSQREKGLIQADTAAQAQARLVEIIKEVAKNQQPPLEVGAVELGQARPFGVAYGEVAVSITVQCRTDQLVNFVAFLSAQPELISTEEIRLGLANEKLKSMPARLTISAMVPRRLVPDKKAGAGL